MKLTFFLPFCLVKLLRRHILTAFSITFLTHLKKDGHTLLGLSSKVCTFDHLFTYIVHTLVNSLTISLPEWPENQKYRSLSFSANSVGLHFRERVEKIKENGKKKKNSRKPTKWAGKYGGKKTHVRAHLGQNFKNIIISSNVSLKLL